MHFSTIQHLDKSMKQLHYVAISHIAPVSYSDTSFFLLDTEQGRKVNVRT